MKKYLEQLAAEKNLKIGRIKFYHQEWFFIKNKRGKVINRGDGLLFDEARLFIEEYQPGVEKINNG